MKSLSKGLILKQIKEDLIGKDSHRGVTLTYAWLANQTGHFALGFIPTLLFCKYPFILKLIFPRLYNYNPYLSAALLVTIIWFLFELYNFLGPLLLKKPSRSKIVYLPKGEKLEFKPDWKHIGFDTGTDVLFFSLGAFFAAYYLADWPAEAVLSYILLGIFLVLVYPISYWYQNKMYHQGAKYPLQFRMSQWTKPINKEQIEKINIYLDNVQKAKGHHILISGKPLSGKSSLAIGLGTEVSLKMNKVIHFKSFDFFEYLFDNKLDEKWMWGFREAELVVVDDMCPSGENARSLLNLDQIINKFNKLNDKHKDLFLNKNFVWVLGGESDFIIQWQKELEKKGVNRVTSISL